MRRISIVFQENGKNEGKGFDCYLSGDTERLGTFKTEDEMSPAEFWGFKMFQIVATTLRRCGIVVTEQRKQ